MSTIVRAAQRGLLAAVSIVALAACGHEQTSATTTTSAQSAPAPSQPSAAPSGQSRCPMGVAGAKVSAANVPGGVEMTFSAPSDQVNAVRARVHAMGQNGMSGACPCPGMMHGMNGRDAERGMAMAMPASRVRVDDVEGGARVTFTPKDPGDLDALRARVHTHADHMQSGACAASPRP